MEIKNIVHKIEVYSYIIGLSMSQAPEVKTHRKEGAHFSPPVLSLPPPVESPLVDSGSSPPLLRWPRRPEGTGERRPASCR
jgi:hypothetical protein